MVAKPQEPSVEAAAVADVAGTMAFHWTFARTCQTPGRSSLPTPKRTVLRRPFSLSLPFEKVKPLNCFGLFTHPEDLEIATQTARSRHLRTIDVKFEDIFLAVHYADICLN